MSSEHLDTPVPLHITFRDLAPTPSTEREVRARVAALSGPRCRVVRVLIERAHPRGRRRASHRREAGYRALVVLALASGKRLSLRSRVQRQPMAAIGEAFSAARRLLRQRLPAPVLALEVAS